MNEPKSENEIRAKLRELGVDGTKIAAASDELMNWISTRAHTGLGLSWLEILATLRIVCHGVQKAEADDGPEAVERARELVEVLDRGHDAVLAMGRN